MQIFDSPDSARASLGSCIATIGKYDGMHLGHQRILDTLLEQAKKQQLPSVVILSEPQPDEFFAPQSAPPRLNHFQDKVDFLTSYGVDAVLRLNFDVHTSQIPAEHFVTDYLLQRLGVNALVVGDDFRFGKNRLGDFSLLQQLSTQHDFVVLSVAPCCSGQERVSSTLVRQYLQSGDCDRVSQLLGRAYSIGGEVVLGRQLGRQLGTPTANVKLLNASLPMTGVFAVSVEWQEGVYRGVANLGVKPTVSDLPVPSLEVHVLDFDKNLYGESIRVHFLHKLRDEKKFNGLQELKEQIAQDIAHARTAHAATENSRDGNRAGNKFAGKKGAEST